MGIDSKAARRTKASGSSRQSVIFSRLDPPSDKEWSTLSRELMGDATDELKGRRKEGRNELAFVSDSGGDIMNTDKGLKPYSSDMHGACGDKSMEIRNMGILGAD